jgi:hypothetical protein
MKPLPTIAAIILFATQSYAQSPICDGNWHWVYVPGAVCMDGTATGFQYACSPTLGPTGPLLVIPDGGGACWDADTCNCGYDPAACANNGNCCTITPWIATNHFDVSLSCDGQPYGGCDPAKSGDLGSQIALNSPTSAFNTTGGTGAAALNRWNMVFIPACTGDPHVGNGQTRVFTASTGETYTATFNGYNNVVLDVTALATLFNPSNVALAGGSGGSIATSCHMQEVASIWPQLSLTMQNAVPPASASIVPDLPTAALLWGTWTPGPSGKVVGLTCPVPANSFGLWGLDLVAKSNAKRLPAVRKALTADYSDATINNFYLFLGAAIDPDGTCTGAMTTSLFDALANDIGPSNPTFKVYYHNSYCHAERWDNAYGYECISGNNAGGPCSCKAGATSCNDAHSCGAKTSACQFDPGNCNYDSMVVNGVHFNDWMRAWANPAYGPWDDVVAGH